MRSHRATPAQAQRDTQAPPTQAPTRTRARAHGPCADTQHRRTRAHAQRDVTFLEKAKVPLQLDTGPRKSLSPAPEEVLC